MYKERKIYACFAKPFPGGHVFYIASGKRCKDVLIDLAETGNLLHANERKVVVLCRTNKGID